MSACSWAGRHGVAMAMAAEVVRAGWSLFGWPAAACLPISAPPLAVVAGGSELTTGNAGARRVGEWRKAPH